MEIGGGLTFLAYIIHPAFFGIHFGLLLKSIVDKYMRKTPARGLIKQIGEEMHYYIMASVAVASTLEALGYKTPDVMIRSTEIIKLLIGA